MMNNESFELLLELALSFFIAHIIYKVEKRIANRRNKFSKKT